MHHVRILQLLVLLVPVVVSSVYPQERFDIRVLDEYEYVENQVIIKFRDGTPAQDISSIRQSLNASLVQEFIYLTAEVWEISGIGVRNAILQYRDHPAVEYIEPNVIITLDLPPARNTDGRTGRGMIRDENHLIPNDPLFDQMWHLHNTGQTGGTPGADIDATRAWNIHTGDTILVAIVDTGIDYNHPDLAGNMWEGIGQNFIEPWESPMDGNGHGTHVAGTVAAVGNNEIGVTGVAWIARLVAVKVFNDGGGSSTVSIVNGVEYTVSQNVQISNHSWGGIFQQVIYEAFQLTEQAGQLVVAAAGNHNESNDVSPRYPAAFPLENIVAVAASNHNDGKAWYSAWGPTTVHIAAPGGDGDAHVVSTLPGNNYGGSNYFGTSMASPHAAGAAVLVWSRFPEWTFAEVKNALMFTVDPLGVWQNDYPIISGGRLNVYKALIVPRMVLEPAELIDEVFTGDSLHRTLSVYNAGESDLELEITVQDAGWITISAESGTVAEGDSMLIEITFDASELPAGLHTADIVISSNDPAAATVSVPVELTVILPLPDQVILAYPGDAQTVDIPDDSLEIQLTWHPSQPEVTNYQLDIAKDSDFNDIVYTDDAITDTFYVFSGIEDNETYYWRVRAENETGWGLYSEAWSFTAIIVGVGHAGIPSEYTLLQNYPNPFNPSTVIRYGLPERSTVKLEIYNTLGQRVATLVNAELEAGYYDVEWYSGRAASGIYFYRLEAVPAAPQAASADDTSKRFIRVKRMLMLK